MKTLSSLIAVLAFSVSMGVAAYNIDGSDVDVSEEVQKHCATANNYWVCVNNAQK